ncbi:MAG: anthranilate synthase component I [Chitinivibrionales bacterium]|nr:anthranilate synthase component I [Chitinivibrionales bacterium]MBD3394567.1 anthranilate synthase component I [Chitinivibrionales bacterium]
MVVYPSRDEAACLAKEHGASVVPVCRAVLADTETPVSVWLKLFKDTPYSFLLESVTGGELVARYSFTGGDPFLTFRANGRQWKISGDHAASGEGDPIAKLREIMARYRAAHVPGIPRFCGGAVGYCSYDSVRLWEDIPDANPKDDPLDEIFFGLYRTLVAFDNREHRLLLITNLFLDASSDIDTAYRDAVHTLGRLEDRLSIRLASSGLSVGTPGPVTSNFERHEFEKAVERCKEYITAGDIFQVVLSQRFSVPVKANPFDLYRILRTINPSPYMFYLSCRDTSVIGASPEMLARVEDRTLEVRPIAGTRRRGEDAHEDDRLAAELLADPKERAEHIMLVDLGRNDAGRVCEYGSVVTEEMMHIEKYSHVIHIVSNVRGRLKDDRDVFDALYSCFPAGTLSGAPKIRAMQIIDELEPVRRGLYGGALGYIDFSGNFDSCIVIRTMVYKNGVATVQAGAGIVADSVPSTEYEETVNKAKALFTAMRDAARIVGNS